jgi:hypothetical protein
MQIKPGNYCPLVKEECLGLKCSWFTQIRGSNPNTGADVDEWACAIAWMPVLLIENSQQQRQTGAAVESFRNEMVTANEKVTRLFAMPTLMQIEGGSKCE